MGNWLIDKTSLIGIKHDLVKQARVGDAVLGLLGLGNNNEYVSLIPGGISLYLPAEKKDASTGTIIRRFEILLIDPVTVQICKKIAALQMGNSIYKKVSHLPYDGVSTPAQWVINTSYTGEPQTIDL